MLDGKRILIAEDDKDIVEMYQDYFAFNKNTQKAIFTYTCAPKTTKEALDNNSFDVMLLDLGVGDYAPPLRLVFLKEYAKKIKIIVITAYTEYKEECFRLGAIDFLPKPSYMSQIIEAFIKAVNLPFQKFS